MSQQDKVQEQVAALNKIRKLVIDNFSTGYYSGVDLNMIVDELKSCIALSGHQHLEYNDEKDEYYIDEAPTCKNCGNDDQDILASIPMISGKNFYICTDCMTTIKNSKTLYQVSGGGKSNG